MTGKKQNGVKRMDPETRNEEGKATNGNQRSENSSSDYKPMERVIRATLASLRENQKRGWKRLVTVTQWGGGKFKLDIREWNSDMTRSTKGMTFTRSEVEKLRNVLSIIDLNIIDDFTPPEAPANVNSEAAVNVESLPKAV